MSATAPGTDAVTAPGTDTAAPRLARHDMGEALATGAARVTDASTAATAAIPAIPGTAIPDAPAKATPQPIAATPGTAIADAPAKGAPQPIAAAAATAAPTAPSTAATTTPGTATPPARIPATIVTGFLGAGKTTLLRHLLEHAGGRRIAIIVNEFGALGIDGDTLRACGITGCDDDDIVELANGCLCCTVADDFLPTMQALVDRPNPPDHIVIETSGLALPKPLLKAFNWPSIRTRVTVDGVVTVVDAPAVAAGRFADDPDAVAAARAADPSLDHDNPLAEVYEDQLMSADLVVLNKSDLLDAAALDTLSAAIAARIPRAVKLVRTEEGRLDPQLLLGLDAQAELDLAARPSHHDAEDGAHEHDDFESFVVEIPAQSSPDALLDRLRATTSAHDILRMKGFAEIAGRPMRLAIQGVGTRFRHQFDRAWTVAEPRAGGIVVIGRTGLDRAAITADIRGDTP